MNGWHARAKEVAFGTITDTNHVYVTVLHYFIRAECALFTPTTAKLPRYRE